MFRVCFLASLFLVSLAAEEPQMFRYQGRILDNDALVSGNLNFRFKLYDSPTGGWPLYTDTATITVVDGLYSTMIGDDTASGGDLGNALSNPAVYLEITVEGETLSPRERIVSVPYAMNSLPSGSVVLSTTNPNTALEAKGYSLLYSDVTSSEDWASGLQNSLVIPFSLDGGINYYDEMVAFGSYVGFLSNDMSGSMDPDPFYYTSDGITWNDSTPPFKRDSMASEDVVLNGTLYLLTRDMDGALMVASTVDGAEWSELSVSSPVSMIQELYEVEAFANQIWLFGADSSYDHFILKSSDGATWTAVTPGAWDAMSLETESTPTRLLAVALASGGGTSSYVWSTTDGASWTQSSAVLPVSSDAGSVEVTHANDALWVFGMPEGGTIAALYKSTNWGDSWTEVSSDLPANIDLYHFELESLGAVPGLLLSDNFGATADDGKVYITKNGSNWSLVSSQGFDEVSVLSNGQVWLYYGGGAYPTSRSLYSIGGPLRSGRLFHYQKD